MDTDFYPRKPPLNLESGGWWRDGAGNIVREEPLAHFTGGSIHPIGGVHDGVLSSDRRGGE